MNSVLGCGMHFIGHIDRNEDDSYLTTKWFCLFFLPFIPIASYRVIKGKDSTVNSGYTISSTANYLILEEHPINLFQTIFTYLGVILLPLSFAIMMFAMMSDSNIDSLFVQIVTTSGFLLSPIFTAIYAKKTYRRVVAWLLAGLIIPWILPLILVFLKSKLPGNRR